MMERGGGVSVGWCVWGGGERREGVSFGGSWGESGEGWRGVEMIEGVGAGCGEGICFFGGEGCGTGCEEGPVAFDNPRSPEEEGNGGGGREGMGGGGVRKGDEMIKERVDRGE